MFAILSSALGVELADLPGLRLSSGASLALMGGYYFIQPLADTMSLRAGVAAAPYLNACGVILMALCNPLYQCLLNMMPLSQVQPFMHRFLSACLVAFAGGFVVYNGLAISFAYSIFLSVLAPFLMSTFWVRMAHVHTQAEAHRVYGVVAAADGALFGTVARALGW